MRVLAASNRDVEGEVRAGRFRQDLFYRLNAVAIRLPPLRERRDDILPFAKRFAEQVHTLNPSITFTPEAMHQLEEYPWPGNIRELENAVVRAASMCDGTIRVQDLPERIRTFQVEGKIAIPATKSVSSDEPQDWISLSEVEAGYVTKVLEHTRGNKQAAARVLRVDRKTLDRMIKRHDIDFGKFSRSSPRRFVPGLVPSPTETSFLVIRKP